MKDWLRNLTGGGPINRSNVIPGMVQPEEGPPPPTIDVSKQNNPTLITPEQKKSIFEEDSVLHDLKLLKNFVAKKLGLMSEKAGQKMGEVKSSNRAMKIIKRLVMFGIILILIFVGFSVFNKVRKDMANKEDEIFEQNNITPTPINYLPNTPSKYADDENVLVLEEQIEALEKEINRTNLRDSSIYPPNVDYNVVFEKE
jgi:predicted RNA-binding protein